MLSHAQLFAASWTVAHQAPLSMEFPRQEYWSGLPFPPPGGLPNRRVELGRLFYLLHRQVNSSPLVPPEKQLTSYFCSQSCPRIHHSPSPIPAGFVLSCLNHFGNSLCLLTWWPPITLFLWSTFSVTLRDFSYWLCEPYLQWPYNAISYICDLHWAQHLPLLMTIWFSSLWTLSPYSSVPEVSLTDLNPLTLWLWAHLDGILLSTTIIEKSIHMFPSTLIPNLCLAIL